MNDGIVKRIAISIFKDLIVPWSISAACIALFFVVVCSFGLIAWPVCFCAFLFLCVTRRNATPSSNEPDSGGASQPMEDGLTDEELMRRYRITYERKMYIYGDYHYDKLWQAVAHARHDVS
ncbi:hypothetical protein [Lysobacter tyrosinilyticus]